MDHSTKKSILDEIFKIQKRAFRVMLARLEKKTFSQRLFQTIKS